IDAPAAEVQNTPDVLDFTDSRGSKSTLVATKDAQDSQDIRIAQETRHPAKTQEVTDTDDTQDDSFVQIIQSRSPVKLRTPIEKEPKDADKPCRASESKIPDNQFQPSSSKEDSFVEQIVSRTPIKLPALRIEDSVDAL